MAISYRAAQNLIKRGDEPGLRAALEQGLDANLGNQNGWTLLMLAAVEGAVPVGRLLLAHGAKAEASNGKGQTALMLARDRGHALFAELLS